MEPPGDTPEKMRRKARRLLEAARDAPDHETRGKLLAEALNLARLAEVREHERAKAESKVLACTIHSGREWPETLRGT
jgi:hypothetical protein